MSVISVGKRIGDLDIRLGIPPSREQFSVRETNRRISANNVSSNYNSVYNVFRSGMTQAGGFARPTNFIVTIDGPKGLLREQQVYPDIDALEQTARLRRSAELVFEPGFPVNAKEEQSLISNKDGVNLFLSLMNA